MSRFADETNYQTRYVLETDDNAGKTVNINLNSRRSVLMDKISEFFKERENFSILLPIVNGESNLSLRVIDFFVTNYAKKNEILYDIVTEDGKKEKFMVHYSYKAQLKAYSKRQFDPFCRRERIIFFVDEVSSDGEMIECHSKIRTTVGQLNFFRWAISNDVLNYIVDHISEIEYDMNQSHKKGKRSKRVKMLKNKDRLKVTKPEGIEDHVESQEFRINTKKIHKDKQRSEEQEDNDQKDIKLSAVKKISKHNVTITVKFGSD